jgi:predicted small secreted protein
MLAAITIFVGLSVVTACNTVKGAGTDLQHGSEDVSQSIHNAHEEHEENE